VGKNVDFFLLDLNTLKDSMRQVYVDGVKMHGDCSPTNVNSEHIIENAHKDLVELARIGAKDT
jgi:hypothetical protein